MDRKHMLVRYQVSEPGDKKGGGERRQQPLVKRKIMSLTILTIRMKLNTSDETPDSRLSNLPFLAMQKTFHVNL